LGQELTLFIKKTIDIHNNPMEFQSKTADSLSAETLHSTNLLERNLIDSLSKLTWENPYERPRRIEFVDEILMTETQKIKRRESVELWQKTNHQKI